MSLVILGLGNRAGLVLMGLGRGGFEIMAFVLQLDSGGVVNANAYIDETFFNAYHDDRGNDISCFTIKEIQQSIVIGTDYVDIRFEYVGDKLLLDQTTEWPRLDAQDIDDRVVFGIPQAVKEATAEYAFIARGMIKAGKAAQDSLMPTPERDASGQPLKRRAQRVGPISEDVSFSTGGAVGSIWEFPRYPVADNKLLRRGLVQRQRFALLVRGD